MEHQTTIERRQPNPDEIAAHKKRHRKTAMLSTLASTIGICVVILPAVGFLISPRIVDIIGIAVADEIAAEVSKQIAPTNAGIKVMIESLIAELEDEIASLEFRRDNRPETWTGADVLLLSGKVRRLRTQNAALDAIIVAERDAP
jgi:hypothetical protein